jgi:hypothetical protein
VTKTGLRDLIVTAMEEWSVKNEKSRKKLEKFKNKILQKRE